MAVGLWIIQSEITFFLENICSSCASADVNIQLVTVGSVHTPRCEAVETRDANITRIYFPCDRDHILLPFHIIATRQSTEYDYGNRFSINDFILQYVFDVSALNYTMNNW